MTEDRRRWPALLVSAMTNPRRGAILRDLVDNGPASPKQISRRLGLPASTTSEEIRRLRADGLVEQVDAEEKRGALECRFEACESTRWLSDQDWAGLRAVEKGRFLHGLLSALLARFTSAVRWNSADFSADSVWFSTVYAVDDQGWAELAALHRRTVAEAERIVAACGDRAAGSGPRHRACSTIMLFEMPEEGHP